MVHLLYSLNFLFFSSIHAAVIVSEIADKGTSNHCPDKEDWIELWNTGSSAVSLVSYILHDDKGPSDSKAFTFPPDAIDLGAGEFLVLCTKLDGNTMSPQFKIGGDDTVTLRNPSGDVVSTSGILPGMGEFDLTYAWSSDSSSFSYTSTPTPGAVNVFTENWSSVRAQLEKQHTEGEAFFEHSSDPFPPVLDLHLTMSHEDWTYQQEFVSYEVYRPFTGLSIQKGSIIYAQIGGGRARPRGQSTMALAACMGIKAFPWLIDVTSVNKTQRLFGMEKFYLRTHLSDHSYMREWTMHRMLRRFELPYLRTRMVRLLVNGGYVGTYSMMEAPDQDYVFYREFGDKLGGNAVSAFAKAHAMYKIKTHSLGCGAYSAQEVADAQPPKYTSPTDPDKYAFKRGTHRQKLAVHVGDIEKCVPVFYDMMAREKQDVIASWIKHNKDCGAMLVQEGLVDRDLGSDVDGNDNRMSAFINKHLSGTATKGCSDNCDGFSDVPTVNVDDFLKNFAVYAVTLGQDTPIGIGNNYFLASPGGSTEAHRAYRIVQYDHNNVAERAGMDLCAPDCADKAIYWSIERPTCRALSLNPLVGPLLSGEANAGNMNKYLEYVREFNTNVYTDAGLIAEITAHAKAIEAAVKEDPWAFAGGYFYSTELTAAAGKWWDFNLLAFMKARGEEVKKQLAALSNGTFPRTNDAVPTYEPCQDWRSKTTTYLHLPKGCDRAKCSSYGDDCCAPDGEAATCRDGYSAMYTGGGCAWFDNGDYTCCEAASPTSGGPAHLSGVASEVLVFVGWWWVQWY